jgi:hypothetical protein
MPVALTQLGFYWVLEAAAATGAIVYFYIWRSAEYEARRDRFCYATFCVHFLGVPSPGPDHR